MSFETVLEKINAQANNVSPLDASVKFVLDEFVIHIDGTGDSNVVTTDDKDADCVISTDMETFEKLKAGKVNPMMAMMMGKIKIKGDMGIAMKLQSFLK